MEMHSHKASKDNGLISVTKKQTGSSFSVNSTPNFFVL